MPRQPGFRHSDETKQRIREANKEQKQHQRERAALGEAYVARKRVLKAIEERGTFCPHLKQSEPPAMVHGDDPTSLLCGSCYERLGKVRLSGWRGDCDLCTRRRGTEQLVVTLGEVVVTFHACEPCCRGWALLVELENDTEVGVTNEEGT